MPVSESSASGSVHLESRSQDASERGPLNRPAVLLITAGIIALGIYALGYMSLVGSRIGSLIDGAIRSSQSPRLLALSPAIYGIGGLLTFLLLLAVLRFFGVLLQSFRRTVPSSSRPVKSVDDFVEEATGDGITSRVETTGPLPVERSSGTRERTTDAASQPPAAAPAPTRGMPDRNPGSAQRKALHAAALQAIESRKLRPTPASALSRRRADYEGPRRRGSDNTPEPFHRGPFRRSTDGTAVQSTALPTEHRPDSIRNPAKNTSVAPSLAPSANQRAVGKTAQIPESSHVNTTSNRPY